MKKASGVEHYLSLVHVDSPPWPALFIVEEEANGQRLRFCYGIQAPEKIDLWSTRKLKNHSFA